VKFVRNILIAAVVATPLFAQTAPETWVVDKAHSTAQFKVRHMMANTVGQFRELDGNINIDRANPAKSNVDFTIQAKSIDTGNGNRDEHLRSADFFDVAQFPTISFKSTAVAKKSESEYAVTGDLTMHGVTKRVTLPVTFLGFGKTARGEKAGFEIETTVNRKDYGIVWNKTLDEGGLLLGEDVKVTINLEVDRKVAAATPAAK
jgi:polyisoprenoid-binding protein YceI